jgi:hypothetical protein
MRTIGGGVGVLSLILMLALPSSSRGQALAVDPYRPYYGMYDAATNPAYPPNLAFPNAARYQYGGPLGNRRPGSANQMQSFMDSIGAGVALDGGSGMQGLPFSPLSRMGRYDSVFREYDGMYGRVYTPNETADERYLQERQKRDELYYEALRTTDRRKRGELMKKLEEATRRMNRELDTPRRSRTEALGPRTARNLRPAVGATRGTERPEAGEGLPTLPETTARPPFASRVGVPRGVSPDLEAGGRSGILRYLPRQLRPVEPTPEEILERSERMKSGA